jgi:FkbM family methyltransferase
VSPLESLAKRVRGLLPVHDDSPLLRMLRVPYGRALRATYGRRGLLRHVHGEPPIRIRPAYRSAAEDSEPEFFSRFRACVRPGSCVLDVGANIGVYSLLAARWVGARGHVHAFEPAPESLAALKDHIQLNGMGGRITAVGAAVSDHRGFQPFYAASYNGENTLNPAFGRRVPAAACVQVPVTTLDHFCEEQAIAPTVIKIDVEGYEFHVIRGSVKTIKSCRPTLLVELHPTTWPLIGGAAENGFCLIRELGYKVESLTKGKPVEEARHVALVP